MLNRAHLIGNLGQDPELVNTESGKKVCTFRIATTIRAGQGKEETDWHNIVTFDKLAESCEKYLSKGRQVYIEGRIKYRKLEEGRWVTDIIAERVQFLHGKPESDDDNAGNRRRERNPYDANDW